MVAADQAIKDAGLDLAPRRPHPHRDRHRFGRGRSQDTGRGTQQVDFTRPRPRVAVPYSHDDNRHGRRKGFHRLRAQGTELQRGKRMRFRRPFHRRFVSHAQGRHDGRCGLRRVRGGHHAAVLCRVLLAQGAVHAQRTSAEGKFSVRQEARRVRDGRGRGDHRARNARTCAGAQGENLLRAHRVRRHRRRVPPHRAVARRRGRPALHGHGACVGGAETRTASITSTRTAPPPSSTTSSRPSPSRKCSANTPRKSISVPQSQ